jgi:dTDP-4-dehydrorhamnose reductase
MIWIIGNKGMLGKEVAHYLSEREYPIIGTDKEVNILSPLALKRHLNKYNPEWIINCSAYTDIDGAEENWDQAYMVNKEGTASIAYIAHQLDIPLIHISTEHIFDGSVKAPLTEKEKPNPLNVYGASKLAGEEAIRNITKKYFIIRTASLFGEYGRTPIFSLLNRMNESASFRLPNDRTVNPTWTRNVAELIERIITDNSRQYGTYHFSSKGECTEWEFAWEVYRLASRHGIIRNACSIIPGKASELNEKAQRPEYTVLSNEKVEKMMTYKVPDWEASLNDFIQSISAEHLNNYKG